MIRMILRGDVGNQLFEYAVGRHLSLRRGVPLVLNIARRLSVRDPTGAKLVGKLAHMGLQARIERTPAPWLRLAAGFRRSRPAWRLYREQGWGFRADVLDLPDGSVLFGYFQSAAYFAAIAPMIRKDFTFTQDWPDDRARRLADEITNTQAVAVSVRRGDYLRSPLHNVCTRDYFLRAIARMRAYFEAPRFYFFSDDIDWCRRHLALPDSRFEDLRRMPGHPMVGLRLMQHCRHHIISNSTFSWWGAWLAEHPAQKVIAPARWFNDPALDAPAMRHTVPAAWERLAV